MEKLRRERAILRGLFTKAANTLEGATKTGSTKEEIRKAFYWTKQKADELWKVDEMFKEHLYELEDESIIQKEVEQIEAYKLKWFNLETEVGKIIKEGHENVDSDEFKSTSMSEKTTNRKFKLPKIELTQFDGKIKNWLGFWGQFKKIDEDLSVDDDDKYQYLLQATTPGTSARDLVESYPPSGPNYRNVIKMMKLRFARDELLIELYIRELLKLALNKENSSIRVLYDKLMTQLQALETLDVARDKYSSMLYPMVESTLPEDVLRAWERCRTSVVEVKDDDKQIDHLTGLLKFLGREVDSEERIEIARSGFNNDLPGTSSQVQPTAACIISAIAPKKERDRRTCLWCSRDSHLSSECFKARKMTRDAKNDFLKENNACFLCLRKGHSAKKCKVFVKCMICERRHTTVMCPQIDGVNKESATSPLRNEGVMLCYRNNVTLLPALLVHIVQGTKLVTVRALVDSGSQRSYIKKDLAQQLGLTESGNEILGHFLFGGGETIQKEHKRYDINLRSLDGNFQMKIKVLDQEKICGHVPRVKSNNTINQMLKEHKIGLSDSGDEELEIKLLLGSDYYARLITGQFISIDENLVAVKTNMGWTIQGQIQGGYSSTVVSNLVSNQVTLDISDRWKLETLGITGPTDVKSQKKLESDAMEFYRNTVTINKEQRYEVNLLRKDGRPNLQTKINNRMKYLQKLRSDFRSRFKSEYLGLLLQKGGPTRGNLNIGDVVLIETDEKRIKWPLGLVIEIYLGQDSHARVAKVKTASGLKLRAFQKLYPLEIQSSKADNNEEILGYDHKEDLAEKHGLDNSAQKEQITRIGRVVKVPQLLNL